jgi:predicted branched-subunit amino acid permease
MTAVAMQFAGIKLAKKIPSVSFSMSGRLVNVKVKIISFSMAEMCHGQNRPFQH